MWLKFLKFITIVLSPFLIIFVLVSFHVIVLYVNYFVIKKDPLPKRGSFKNRSFLKRIIIDFPIQFIEDIRNGSDYEFKEYGLHMVCGEQGSGKTTTVIYLLQKWKKLYPNCKISTNMSYKYEDSSIDHWKDIVTDTNGNYGKIEVIDEIQTWFSSLQSKDFPPEMLQEVSQQRKQRKAIIGTAQIFSRMAKPIREQTHFIYLPMTIFGCITIVRKSHIKYWNEEKQKFTRYLGMFFFVHDFVLRDSFDTYKKIEKYHQQGFKSENDFLK